MTSTVKLPPRPIAVLKLRRWQVPLLITRALHIVQSMTQSSWFPSPSPALSTVRVAIDELVQSEAATHGGGLVQTTVRNDKERALRLLLDGLRHYVQSVADAHVENAASIIESAGMYVKTKRGGGRRGLRLAMGRISTEVDAVTNQAASRAAYEWSFSLDERVTWVTWAVTNEAKATLTGLPVGARVWVRYRTTIKSVTGDWCDPVTIIVG